MIYWDDHRLMALTPSPLPPPPLIITYNFKQLWSFLSIAVIIKLLCGHWTDVCSQGRSPGSMRQTEALASVILSALSQCSVLQCSHH